MAADRLLPLARSLGRRLGLDVLPAGPYSPVVDPAALPPRLWTEPDPMPGVDLRLDASLALLRDGLAPFVAEYAPPDGPPGTAHGYHRDNGMYGRMDGEVLYAMLRRLRPSVVVEVGAGWSTRVVRDALTRTAAEGGPVAEHRVFDPDVAGARERAGGAEVTGARAEDLPGEVFSALGADDVLLVDTTHAVRPGGDVVRLLLEEVPRLAAGVVVAVHDFFRPYAYPRFLAERHGVHWQEQYLVQALLAHSQRYEVLIANHALGRAHHPAVAAVIRDLPDPCPGSALWLRVTDGGAAP